MCCELPCSKMNLAKMQLNVLPVPPVMRRRNAINLPPILPRPNTQVPPVIPVDTLPGSFQTSLNIPNIKRIPKLPQTKVPINHTLHRPSILLLGSLALPRLSRLVLCSLVRFSHSASFSLSHASRLNTPGGQCLDSFVFQIDHLGVVVEGRSAGFARRVLRCWW